MSSIARETILLTALEKIGADTTRHSSRTLIKVCSNGFC